MRSPARLDERELSFVSGLASIQSSIPRSRELHFRGLRARYLAAKALGAHIITPLPGVSSPVDFHFRGWGVKVKSVSTSVRTPALWFPKPQGYAWDCAVLAVHHPDCRHTISLCGWASSIDWHIKSEQGELYGKPMWLMPEESLRPFNELLLARSRWDMEPFA